MTPRRALYIALMYVQLHGEIATRQRGHHDIVARELADVKRVLKRLIAVNSEGVSHYGK